MSRYKVVNAGDLFNGLIVEGYCSGGLLEVRSVSKTNDKLKQFSISVPERMMWFSLNALKLLVDEEIELDTTSPFGEFIDSGSITHINLTFNWAQYENAVSLNVSDNGKTLCSYNFLDKNEREEALSFVSDVSHRMYDWDDIVFDIEYLKS